MKRVLALLFGAFVVVWAAALFDFSGRGAVAPAAEPEALPPAQAAAPQQVTHKVAAQPVAAREPEVSPTVAPDPPAAPAPARAATKSTIGAIVRAAQGSVAVIGKTARTLLRNGQPEAVEPKVRARAPAPESTGELGEGVLSPEFEEYEQRYAKEPRDGEWAPAQEQRVQALLKGQPWADKVSLVHCQQTVCRIVVEADTGAKDTFAQLVQVPGLSEATGLRTDAPYSLRTGQLSVYFRRDGEAAHAP